MKHNFIFLFLLLFGLNGQAQFPIQKINCDSIYESTVDKIEYSFFSWCDIYNYNWEGQMYEEDGAHGHWEFYLKKNDDNVTFTLNDICFACDCIEDSIYGKSYNCHNDEGEIVNLVYFSYNTLLFRKNPLDGIYTQMFMFIN